MVIGQSSPFGGRTRTETLLSLQLVDESYARELARLLKRPVSGVRKALQSPEANGLVAARSEGRRASFDWRRDISRLPSSNDTSIGSRSLKTSSGSGSAASDGERGRPASGFENHIGGAVRTLSATDSCRDRLAAFYHWADRQSLDVAVLIALRNRVDMRKISGWSAREGAAQGYGQFVRELARARRRSRKRDLAS